MRPEADHGEASARKKVMCRVFCEGRPGSSSIEGTGRAHCRNSFRLAFCAPIKISYGLARV
jgi:hypothetical protein